MTYLWSHHPFLTAVPKERLKHKLFEGKTGNVDEVAVFKLENEKYLYIRFCGLKEDADAGYTDMEEFENKEDAIKLYEEIIGE